MTVTISAGDVKKLREITRSWNDGLQKSSLLKPKEILIGAIDLLRKKGQKVAAKRADRDANEGIVVAQSAGNKGILVSVSSETDFVAKNEGFQTFAKSIGSLAIENFPYF